LAQVPLIRNVLPPGDNTTSNIQPGNDLFRFFLTAPQARCNDGTPAAVYLRQATNAQDADKWLLYLQGGGSCLNGEECAERWTSQNTAYGAQKMSTRIPVALWGGVNPPQDWVQQGAQYTVPPGIAGNGIFAASNNNPFAGWNMVFAYYCSSDEWSGQAANQVLTAGATQYRIHFRGADIFDAIIAQLRSGATAYTDQEGASHTMPDLDSATMVLLAGSSAGGNGVKHNLDRLRTALQALHPLMQVRGVIDAAGAPSTEQLACLGAGCGIFPDYQTFFTDQWTQMVGNWNARVDASCVALNPVETWRCADTTHVLRHHITSPFFHRMDLQDNNSVDTFQIFFPAANYQLEFAHHVELQLHDIAALDTLLLPRYANELASVLADPQWLQPGVFGPRCTNHVGLTGNRPFVLQTAPDLFGVNTSNYVDALFDWVTTTAGPGVLSPVFVSTSGIGSSGLPQCP
jgi:hypothetical protein